MDIAFAHDTRLYLGIYELELNRYLSRICRPGVKTFDVGGQHGYDALLFAKLTGAEVVSFECNPDAVTRMAHSVALNPTLAPLISVEPSMVGTGDSGTVSLDNYSAGSFSPGFVKIDVEGGELDVLRGAADILMTCQPALVVEVHSARLEQECGRFLADRGYRPRIVSQRRVLPDHRPTEEVNRWLVAGL